MKIQTRTLGFKLLAGGFLLLLIPVLTVGIFSDIHSSDALYRVSGEQVVNIAKNMAALVRMSVEKNRQSLEQLSHALRQTLADTLENPDEKRIRRLDTVFSDILEASEGDFRAIFLTGKNGKILSDGNSGQKGKDISGQKYFAEVQKGKSALGPPFSLEKESIPLLPVSVPLYAEEGNFAGTLTAFVSLASAASSLLSVRVGDSGYLFMADRNGIILLHPEPEYIFTLDIKTLDGMENITAKMLGQQTGVEKYVFKGVRKIAGYAPVGIQGWTVGVTQPEMEFRKEIFEIRKFMAVFLSLSLVLGLGAVYLFAKKIIRSLWKVVRGLGTGAEQVSSASMQIASASQALAENASEQAASLEQTSATLVELAAMSRETSDLTKGGKELMNANIQKSGYSLKALVDLTRRMQGIESESDKIRGIISTIDEIAFQTNLLALNAAIEAARAGEAGSGFAVVAGEVRNLALRSAEAARITQELLAATIQELSDAAKDINRINNDFVDIIESATKMGEKTAAITAATKEQSGGIEQISLATGELEQVTQQMAAHSQETAAASEELSAQSEEMRGFVQELVKVIAGQKNSKPGDNNG
ncbi:MAG: methyl-accepting chemotaxis protein [Desulfococcaceae bacterium]|jgi:methyl-accepting chemotaxis protein|nr:methyl-accepting chemotaxis protein [Desulfococcaceae bacterium]